MLKQRTTLQTNQLILLEKSLMISLKIIISLQKGLRSHYFLKLTSAQELIKSSNLVGEVECLRVHCHTVDGHLQTRVSSHSKA